MLRTTLILDKGNGKSAAAILEIAEKIVGNLDVTVVIIHIGDANESFVAITAHEPIDEE
ncbi:hypothetical protein [Rhizobium leguminosarum]|uniref:hypothetical protein n=1 Tax=Rhizobium leguminosarum TaxID=384 RepID=UPI001441ABAB|nr:hypothetical protein [Rhizobium leguminosarum]